MSNQDNQIVTEQDYTSYSQVPWYRKNWFALVCGLFFAPGLIYPLATGNFYYEKNGQVVAYTKLAKIFLLAWASLIMLAFITKVFEGGSVFEDKKISLVKNGTLHVCPNSTIKQMVDGFMGKPSYEAGTGEGGQQFVNIGGDITFQDKPVRAVIQFFVNEKEGTFEYQAFELNEVPQANLIAMALLHKMCESAEKKPVANPEDFSKGDTNTPSSAAQTTNQPPRVPNPVEQPASVATPITTTMPSPDAVEIPQSSSKSWSPSFDCAKASTVAEKAICTDALLGKLDGVLAENYKYMVASNIGDGAKNSLKATQREWLVERNRCADNQCLENAYRKRIDEVCEYPVISGIHPACTSSDEVK